MAARRMSPRSLFSRLAGLAGWIALSFLAAAVGALASLRAEAFYAQLVRPDWAPSAAVFGPVWTALYAFMGVAAWLVWRAPGSGPQRVSLALFLVQLIFNALWSWLFFAWRLGGLAFMDICLLWLLVAATLVGFWRIRPPAGALLVPYLAWVSFAAALNYSIWQRNPELLSQAMP